MLDFANLAVGQRAVLHRSTYSKELCPFSSRLEALD